MITRNNVTNVLPTRELKIDFLRTSNALGKQAVSQQRLHDPSASLAPIAHHHHASGLPLICL